MYLIPEHFLECHFEFDLFYRDIRDVSSVASKDVFDDLDSLETM